MKICFVTFRSITAGQQGLEVLRRGGIHASLTRTPRRMEEQGCGYRLGITEDKLSAATAMLQANGVPYSKIYCPDEERKGAAAP